MKNYPKELYTLLKSIGGIMWEADTDMQQFTFISDNVKLITGFSSEDWLTEVGFWETHIHPEDKHIIADYSNLKNEKFKKRTFDYRMVLDDGEIIWIKDNVSVLNIDGDRCYLGGIMLDNTASERLRALEKLELDILKLTSDFSLSLGDILYIYLQGVESLFPQMQCSIHRIKNKRFISGISPSLPTDYIEGIIGHKIGNNEGSCGTAAATKRQVIVSDIATDIIWAKYSSIALKYNLRACWSNPVIAADGEVIATLAMYYKEPKSPTEIELQVMEKATAMLRIIIENRRKTEIINEANLLMLQSQELAHFGNWRWDVQHDIVSWSPALYTIYGLDQNTFKATFAGYQERLHPEDKNRVRKIIENVLESGEGTEFEERIIRPIGDLRYLRSWAKLRRYANGKPIEMIGACLDITEKVIQMKAIELQNKQLLEIAWMQSHVIRSPLTKIMSLVELIKDTPNTDPEKITLLEYLLHSAHEMDELVKRINNKAEQPS